jgi:hypothetical protein
MLLENTSIQYKKIVVIASAILLLGCMKSAKDEFKETSSGKAMLSCVAGGGSLNIEALNLDGGKKGVNTQLKKNSKEINMQFAVDGSINQASLIGASVPGEKKLTKFSLMLDLELMCGGELASKMLPDDYRNLQMLNQMQGMFR